MVNTKGLLISALLLGNGLIIVLIIAGITASSNVDVKELKLVHIIVRHGVRTPVDTYPTDPYINETFNPVGWGHLTNAGKLQLYEFGKYLRARYDRFLGKLYTPDKYHAQSTDVDRTKASVQLINAGLWVPDAAQKWGPLDWQPIPVHAEPLDVDALLLVRKPCPQYNIELARVNRTPYVKKKLIDYEELFEYLAKHSGKSVKDFDDVQDLYTTLQAESDYNLVLPNWTKGYFPEKMRAPAEFSYVLRAYNDKLKRLKGGVLLKKLLDDWSGVAHGKADAAKRLAYLYGGHDSTIANILSALNVFQPQVPAFGTAVLLEFSIDKITKSYGLEIFVKNTTEPAVQVTIPGCEPFCTFEKLLKLTRAVVPADWEHECRTNDTSYKEPPQTGP